MYTGCSRGAITRVGEAAVSAGTPAAPFPNSAWIRGRIAGLGGRYRARRLGFERPRIHAATAPSPFVSSYDAFAAICDDWASHMIEDVPFYVEPAREADGPVVELAVGNGRVAIPVAQALG